jgi:acetyl esterase/lipase
MITRRSVALSLGAALGALAVRAQQRQGASDGARAEAQPSIAEIIRMPVVYTVPGMADVKVREGLVYKTAEGSPLHFDLYAPAQASRASPAVILVHGGPIPILGARRWKVFESYGRILAASGMAGIAFDHRLLGVDRLRDSASDLADLVQHLRENAKALGVDQNRLALWTFSGGGWLVSSALRERQRWWKLLVAYYGIMEPFGNSRGDTSLSPIAALGQDARNVPPIVLARAGRDDPGINATIDRFVTAANSAGATVDLFTHPTGRHSFDILDANDRSRQIIQRTIAALRGNLGTDPVHGEQPG